ncbi:alpha/beta hydrolase (plasmid) [Caballeronia sp. NK8]|uniref:alpha/beta fold hydrolase n=1 Tax=Caballeronia sp. NK8 TaxID=140098 RepID=UPI001BB5E0C0|nr:alpha/beta hydrolase [Caballeronia sp. NK8]BCQ28142.1 alpha/beta hydrolase [Caballeronia sp. NK8]
MNTDSFAATRNVDFGPVGREDHELPGFEHRFETVDGIRFHYVAGGVAEGETVVLLAGFPQSWFAWRRVMPLLAQRFRVIAPDLPGQGDTDRPSSGYDTQTIAARLHEFLKQLNVTHFMMAAHDVGAWVAYPFAAMFGEVVLKRLALLDAGIPGITLPDALPTAPHKAWRTWHFAFHTVADLPEALIEGKERIYLDWFLRRKTANPQTFSERDLDEYQRVFMKDGGLRAGLAFYRAAALSAEQNRALTQRGKLAMPILAVSADQGSIPDMGGPLCACSDDVTSIAIRHSGHFIPEEQPDALASELIRFFS